MIIYISSSQQQRNIVQQCIRHPHTSQVAHLLFCFPSLVSVAAANENGKHFGSSRCWLVFQLEPDFLRDYNWRNAFKSLLHLFPFKSPSVSSQLPQTKQSHCFRTKYVILTKLKAKLLLLSFLFARLYRTDCWLRLCVWEMFGVFRGWLCLTGQIQRHIGVACWLVNLQCFGSSVTLPTGVCHTFPTTCIASLVTGVDSLPANQYSCTHDKLT